MKWKTPCHVSFTTNSAILSDIQISTAPAFNLITECWHKNKLAFYLLLPLLSNITKLIKGCKTSNVLRHSVMYTFMYCIIISRIYLSVRRNCDYSIHRVLFWVSIWLVVYPVTVPKAQPTAIQHVPRYALKGGESGYNTESLTVDHSG